MDTNFTTLEAAQAQIDNGTLVIGDAFKVNGEDFTVLSPDDGAVEYVVSTILGFVSISLIIYGIYLFVISSGIGFSGPKDNAAQLISDQLKSPSSYVELDSDIIYEGTANDGNEAYIVKVTYEATNGFGGAVRTCQHVSFTINELDKISYYKNSVFSKCGSWGNDAQSVESLVRINFNR